MPIIAVGGRWDVMSVFEDIFFSGTHGGEALVAGGRSGGARRGRRRHGPRARSRTRAPSFKRACRRSVERIGRGQSDPDRWRAAAAPSCPAWMIRASSTKSYVQQTFAEHGILFNGSMFICARHSDDDIDRTLAAFASACDAIVVTPDLRPLLSGAPVSPVFRAP